MGDLVEKTCRRDHTYLAGPTAANTYARRGRCPTCSEAGRVNREKRYYESGVSQARKRRYEDSERGRLTRQRYEQSESGKERRRRFDKGEKKKISSARYEATEKAHARKVRYDTNPAHLLHDRRRKALERVDGRDAMTVVLASEMKLLENDYVNVGRQGEVGGG